jgi:hypothetical protein
VRWIGIDQGGDQEAEQEAPPSPGDWTKGTRMVRGNDGRIYWLRPGQQLPPGVTTGAVNGASAEAPTPKLTKPVATSEGERNAAGFYERAKMTGAEINRLEDEGGALPSAGTDIAGFLGDYAESKAMSEKQQTYKTAAMAWIRAKLRKESGAAIADSEAASEYKTYFPVPGDSPARIAFKRRLRTQAEQELQTSAGRALPGEITEPGSVVNGQVIGGGSAAYQEYLQAFNQAKGDPGKQRAITEKARSLGVVK